MQGRVRYYNSGKGYGLISPDQGGPDIFVHASAVEASGLPSVVAGQNLLFDVVNDSQRGDISAQNLRAVYEGWSVEKLSFLAALGCQAPEALTAAEVRAICAWSLSCSETVLLRKGSR